MTETVEIERVFNTAPRRLFRAWTDAVELATWWGTSEPEPDFVEVVPDEGVTTADEALVVTFEPNPAGSKLVLQQQTSNDPDEMRRLWTQRLDRLDELVSPGAR